MKIFLRAANILIALALSSCVALEKAPYEAQLGLIQSGGITIFYNSQGPLSYPTNTRLPEKAADIGEVYCRSCQHGVSVPTSASTRSTNISAAQGDGSFRKALEELRRQRPELKGIYDVKVDTRRQNVLGFYRRVCTEVAARGFR